MMRSLAKTASSYETFTVSLVLHVSHDDAVTETPPQDLCGSPPAVVSVSSFKPHVNKTVIERACGPSCIQLLILCLNAQKLFIPFGLFFLIVCLCVCAPHNNALYSSIHSGLYKHFDGFSLMIPYERYFQGSFGVCICASVCVCVCVCGPHIHILGEVVSWFPK